MELLEKVLRELDIDEYITYSHRNKNWQIVWLCGAGAGGGIDRTTNLSADSLEELIQKAAEYLKIPNGGA